MHKHAAACVTLLPAKAVTDLIQHAVTAQLIVGVFLLVFSCRGWGLTGLWVLLSASLFKFSVNPEIIPAIYKTAPIYIPVLYIVIDMIFAGLHATERMPKNSLIDMGSNGGMAQAGLISGMAVFHGIMFFAMMNPPLTEMVGYLAIQFAKVFYTPLILVFHVLQVLFLFKGIKHGIHAIRSFDYRNLSFGGGRAPNKNSR